MIFGMYSLSPKSSGGPTACQWTSSFSRTGASATPTDGTTIAAVAIAPAL